METAEERADRLRTVALRAADNAVAAEDALDALVKKSIRLYGP